MTVFDDAAIAAVSLQEDTVFPPVFIATAPQSDCIMSRGQLIAGAADTMPS